MSSVGVDRFPVDGSLDRVIEDLLDTGMGIGPGGEEIPIASFAVSGAAGGVLEEAAAAARPGGTVEIGLASALSTLMMCRGRRRGHALRPGSFIAIDPRQTSHWKSIGRFALARAGLERVVSVCEEPAHVVLPRRLARGERYTLAFIDGWHMLDFVMVEAFYCDLMLEVGGILALHDLWMPALQHFVSFWLANRAYEPVTVHGGLFSTAPRPSPARVVGDLRGAPALFRERVLPYVDQSVLLLRKTGEDGRAWDEFREYARMPFG